MRRLDWRLRWSHMPYDSFLFEMAMRRLLVPYVIRTFSFLEGDALAGLGLRSSRMSLARFLFEVAMRRLV